MKFFHMYLTTARDGLLSIPICAAVITAGRAVFSGEGENLLLGPQLDAWFACYPLMMLIMCLLFGVSLCTVHRNLALSLGSTRRAFFQGLQAVMLAFAGVCWAVQRAMIALVGLLDLLEKERLLRALTLIGLPWWVFPLLCLAAVSLGCACGILQTCSTRSRIWGVLTLAAVCLAGVVGTVAILAASMRFGGGDAPALLSSGAALAIAAGAAVCLALCEWGVWKSSRRAVVR